MGEYIIDTPRAAQETRGSVRTFTGRYVNPLALRSRDVCIEDIAHHLSIEPRFCGATPTGYRVAQHSVMGSRMFRGPMMRLAFLLHDSAEYLFKDIPSPVKRDPRMKWYKDLEHETTRMIFGVFGLRPQLLDQTKRIDDAMFKWECESWWGYCSNPIVPWSEKECEQQFLLAFHEYYGKLQLRWEADLDIQRSKQRKEVSL